MAYVVCKNPVIQIDIMIPQKYWPRLVGVVRMTGCTYEKEDWIAKPKGTDYIILRDIQAKKGHMVGDLLKTINAFEQEAAASTDGANKFYILVRPKRKVRKNVQKNRKEASAGSEGRNTGKPSGDIQSRKDSGNGGGNNSSGASGSDDLRDLEVLKDGADDRDQ